jgi:hypothetical protein
MQHVRLSYHGTAALVRTDDSVPWRRGGMAKAASSTTDVETTSAENEGDLATA